MVCGQDSGSCLFQKALTGQSITSRWARGGAMRAAAGGGVWTRLGAFLLCFCFVSSAKVYVAYGHYFWWHIPVAVLYTNPIGFSLYCIYIYIGVYL